MILQALTKYYDILQREGNRDLPKEGFTVQKISFALVLSKEGELKGIMDLRNPTGKKNEPQEMLVPEQKGRSGKNAPAYFLCDNAKYVLGVGDKEGFPSFNNFRKLHKKYLKEDNPLVKFLNYYNPSNMTENLAISKYINELSKNPNLVFKIEGENNYLHEKEDLINEWQKEKKSDSDEIKMQCLITGKYEAIARTHTPIKGVRNAQPAGANIVSFNDDSFCSYGKISSYNAPISKRAMFKYTTVLNYLLNSEKNRMIIGDDTVVYWAEKKGPYENLLAELLNPSLEKEEKENTNKDIVDLAKDILFKYATGTKFNNENYQIDTDTTLHILGISPNNARLSISLYQENSFEYFIKRIVEHYNNLNIIGNKRTIPIWMILSETVPKNSKNKKPIAILSKSLMNSIFTGRVYPSSLYNSILSRIRADRDINYKRAAIIKACLIRKYKLSKIKEEVTVSLNENSTSIPYQLGRLFAVLEKAQIEASNINTIKDRYFTSASATPASVFPVILKLSLHHTAKCERTIYFEKLKGEILQKVNEFPKHLSLDEQGEFILGYYHQIQLFFTKKEDK